MKATIIHDGNFTLHLGHTDRVLDDGRKVGCHIQGGEERLLSLIPSTIPRGQHPFATPFAMSGIDAGFGAGVTIPTSEWQARIAELDKLEARVSDHVDFDPWDQQSLPYCWCNSSTQAASTMRRMQGQSFVHFSAASVGAPVANYRKVGGNGGDSLQYLVEHGAVDDKLWANNAVDRSLDTPATQANRENHKVLEWIECTTFEEQITAALLGLATITDFNWWGHSVMGADAVWLDGAIAFRIRNSWGKWGDPNKHGQYGFSVLQGKKMRADNCFAVRQVTVSTQ